MTKLNTQPNSILQNNAEKTLLKGIKNKSKKKFIFLQFCLFMRKLLINQTIVKILKMPI